MGLDCPSASNSSSKKTTCSKSQVAEGTSGIYASEDGKLPVEPRTPDKTCPEAPTTDTEHATRLAETPSNIPTLSNSIRSLQGLEKCGDIPIAPGEITDTWQGVLNDNPVAVRAFRIYPSQDLSEAKDILKRLTPSWEEMNHENVLQFYGIDTSLFPLALVYQWCENGSIMQYLKSNPNVWRPELLSQVTKGLQHLHFFGVVHGNLKGANVLVSGSGTVRISDYGLNLIASNPTFATTATAGAEGPLPWLAPEIITPADETDPDPLTASTSADIFAFAMLTVEVFTGRVPFHGMNNGFILTQIVEGMRPIKPQDAGSLGLTTEIWRYTEECWNQDPTQRPHIDRVVCTWEKFANSGM